MIGQQIGLKFLIPLALEKLQADLYTEGDFYPGDLLANVLNVNAAFWTENNDPRLQIVQLIERKKEEIKERSISLHSFE
jgi:hypothetical protein